MRLFGRQASENGDPDNLGSDPNGDPNVDPNGDPGAGDGEPGFTPQALDLTDATSEDLDALYDEAGGSRFTLEDGTPCDAEGFVIPEVRPGFTPEPVPIVGAPAAPQLPALSSPFGQSVLNDSEREQAEAIFGPQGVAFLETISHRISDRTVQAREQSKQAARQLGIAAEAVDEYAHRIAQVEQFVPAALRGTKEGAVFATALAAAQEANETGGDLGAVFRKLGGAAPAAAPPPPAPKPRVPMPPNAITTTPMSTPDSVRMGQTRPKMKTVAGLTKEQREGVASLTSRNGVRI